MNPSNVVPNTYLLSGWKEIAHYLVKGVRTVQRYETAMRLPIRRPAARGRGSVMATTHELDAWVLASPIRNEFPLTPRAAGSQDLILESVREHTAEMRKLRQQTASLRDDLKSSLAVLRESILSLRAEMNGNARKDWAPPTPSKSVH